MSTGKVKEVEVEVLPPEFVRSPELSRLLAWLLDDFITIPGTKFRIGLDPIVSLVPGFGDASASLAGGLILVQALMSGVPRVVIARMALNLFINGLMGAVPGIGDIFSAWYKSNRKNYQLLVRHSSGRKSTRLDWAIVISFLATLLVAVSLVAIVAGYIVYHLLAFLFGWPR